MGAEIKKANVTPMGMPASTKPIKSGTAEQEQKGVTTPKSAASTSPKISRLPAKMVLVRSGVKKERNTPTPQITRINSMKTLGISRKKKATASPRWVP